MEAVDKTYKKELNRHFLGILGLVKKELNLSAIHANRNNWMALGMTIFGLPIGTGIAFALDNMAFIATFLPIGMVIGMGVGANMDKKAAEEGRQLPVRA